ncbi:hypothetical protein [Roseibium sp.]|uniref:hypothetical protein n=1 Tax=Roseibium sp. TaxID=1936156 RepID=UPI003A97AB0C
MNDLPKPCRLRHKTKHGDDGILVVVFSQVRVPAGKFGLERLFAGTRHNCLFLNDTGNQWYVGLDEEIDAVIDEAVSQVQPTRIIHYGSSMGGYGALLTGLRRRDGEIHAFGPELRPGRPGYQSTDYGVPSCVHDIHPSGQQFPHHLHLYFGCFDPVDAAGAAETAQLFPEADLHLVKSSHASHDHLYSLNIIRKIIRTFDRDPGAELVARGLKADISEETLKQFAALGERLAAGDAVDPNLVRRLPGYDGNPGMIRLAAEAEANVLRLDRAFTTALQAEQLIENDPVLSTLPKRWRKEFPLKRVRWLIAQGQSEGAHQLLLETCRRFPVDDAMKELCHDLAVPLPSGCEPIE